MGPVLDSIRPLLAKWAGAYVILVAAAAGPVSLYFDNFMDSLYPEMSRSSRDSIVQFTDQPKTKLVDIRSTEKSTAPAAKPKAKPASKPAKPVVKPAVRSASSAGNAYSPGYCTWYVKSRRPDLPNNLGNAYSWVYAARAQGIPTGSKPRVGAVGQQGNHVVFVEKVHKNGTITISEMNFAGWGVVSHRTVPASSFTYIY